MGKYLKALAIVCLLGVPSAFAGEIASDQFGYLNNNQSPAVIQTNQAQDLLNVDVTPGGKSVKKRSGYGLYKTLSSTATIHGGHHFFDSSGNDVQIWASSTSLWGIVADGAPTQLISSATLNTTWQCTDSQGFAYCVDSSRDALIKTNGATATWYTSPLGTMVTVTPERLLIAGVAAAPNTIYYSAASNFTNFTVGINVSDSSTEQIASPGSRLTHIQYACGRWLWWKDQSFGYVLGTDQTNLIIKTVSNVIGTQDNSDAIDANGNVFFRAQDGHMYVYDCNSLTKLSVDITPSIQTSGRRISNLWLQSTAADFNSGSFVSSTSYNATNGGVSISTSAASVPDNSFESQSWSLSFAGASFSYASSLGSLVNCGTLTPYDSNTMAFYFMKYPSTAFNAVVNIINANTSVVYGSATVSYADNSCSWTKRTISITAPLNTLCKAQIAIGTTTLTSASFVAGGGNVTFYAASDHTSANSEIAFDYFQGEKKDASVGVYYSAVKNIPNLTSWNTFNATVGNNGGSQTFFVRSSTSAFTILSSTPSWISQTVGAVISASTGTYVQVADTFTITSATQTPTLQNFTLNWYEGTASDKAYALYFDNAIWWSLAYGVGQSTNNYVFKYDLLTPGWTFYDFGAFGLIAQNNNLYFGGTSGNIYRFGNTTNDNGSAINAYWRSKDFAGEDVFLENNYRQFDTIARQNTGQTLTVGYILNGSTASATGSFSVNLSSTSTSTIRYKKLLPNSAIGSLFSAKFSDNSTTSAWEVLGYRVKYDPLSYQPSR